MSTNLYWRPLPKRRPEPKSGYALKWAIARRFGEHDGSCNEGPFTFTKDEVAWLQGVSDADSTHSREAGKEADRLIKCIQDNPQGVEVWIGE